MGQALAISRAAATDAIRRLTSEGFVAVPPQIGCRVRTPEPAEVAESPLTAEIVATFWDRSDFYIRVAFGAFVITDVARSAHRAIARAIVEGDGATAESATRDYLREFGRRVAARLQSD